MQETRIWSLDQQDLLEKEMATYSSGVAWRIPWTEETGGLYSPWGHQRAGHDLVTIQTTHSFWQELLSQFCVPWGFPSLAAKSRRGDGFRAFFPVFASLWTVLEPQFSSSLKEEGISLSDTGQQEREAVESVRKDGSPPHPLKLRMVSETYNSVWIGVWGSTSDAIERIIYSMKFVELLRPRWQCP